ncbi:hypothetical protein L484_009586 [Morus notabilis]|uniref:Uncharacterized protein n=1 Tax=Morus notabilis TaxID=981085 RepID=W9QIV5_9ROSA|nr:hypothetical protein L484_009586 [Morus notabilis]
MMVCDLLRDEIAPSFTIGHDKIPVSIGRTKSSTESLPREIASLLQVSRSPTESLTYRRNLPGDLNAFIFWGSPATTPLDDEEQIQINL